MARGEESRRLVGEVAVVTGSTKGIGRVMAERFACEGAGVVVTGRTESLGRDIAIEINRDGGQAVYVRTDVTVEDDVEAAVEAAVDTFGKLTIMVNNAAPTELTAGPDAIDDCVRDLSSQAWDLLHSGVLKSAFWGCKYAIPRIADAGGGSILNISSVLALRGMKGAAAYSAAKAALHALTRSVAVEEAPRQIRCNCLVVGAVLMAGDTAQRSVSTDSLLEGEFGEALRAFQLTRMGSPEDVAGIATFLTSRESEFFTGVVLPADGGALCKISLPSVSPALFPHDG